DVEIERAIGTVDVAQLEVVPGPRDPSLLRDRTDAVGQHDVPVVAEVDPNDLIGRAHRGLGEEGDDSGVIGNRRGARIPANRRRGEWAAEELVNAVGVVRGSTGLGEIEAVRGSGR